MQEINSFCPECGERFSSSYKSICAFDKCGHLIHFNCNTPYCKICGKWRGIGICGQQSITNIKSIRRIPVKWSWIDRLRGIGRLILSLPIGISLLARIYWNLIDLDYIFWLNDYLCWLINLNIKCSSDSYLKLIDSSYQRVLIANHTNYHDTLVIGSLLDKATITGVVASPLSQKIVFSRVALGVIPHIITEGGNTFNKLTEFFKFNPEQSRLLIFPEGMLSHEKTICKFRSSAFKLGYPVQPIIINYKQNVFDLLGFDFLCQPRIDVEVTVCDPIKTDGSDESIELIRIQMARTGRFDLSDVSNKKLIN